MVVSDRNQTHVKLNIMGNVWLINPRANLSIQAKGKAEIQQGSGLAGPRDHNAVRSYPSGVLISVSSWISAPSFFLADQLIPEAAKSS